MRWKTLCFWTLLVLWFGQVLFPLLFQNICFFSLSFHECSENTWSYLFKYFPQFIICFLIFMVFWMFTSFKFVCNQKYVYFKLYPLCKKFFSVLKLFQFSTTYILLFDRFVVYHDLLFLFDISFGIQNDNNEYLTWYFRSSKFS